MKPPWVGAGCRVRSAPAGGRSRGGAGPPTRVKPAPVCSCIASRRAGSTVAARISTSLLRNASVAAAAGAAVQSLAPAHLVPVAALLLAAPPGGPGDQVRGAAPDLLVAAGTAVVLGVAGAGERAYLPLAVGPLLDPVGAAREGDGTGALPAPGAARAHAGPAPVVLISVTATLSNAMTVVLQSRLGGLPCGWSSHAAAWTTSNGSRHICRWRPVSCSSRLTGACRSTPTTAPTSLSTG